jgi:hypothetical protein
LARKTPQEKKELSYAKDRRNAYSKYAKSSRKNIPLHKPLVNRANRHSAQQALSEAVGVTDPASEDAAEQKVAAKRPKSWRKQPDIPLAEHLARKSGRKGSPEKTG